ncbi:MAG: Cna B-type domain-containing protein [Eubacteriales bacterium]|nr:Cna B-type domain-containing protein [Eubacteriales bacterium]
MDIHRRMHRVRPYSCKKTTPEATVTVTNTNDGTVNTKDVTVNKVWVNGAKPDTTIELWRQGLAVDGVTDIDEKVTVDGGEFTANAETTSHTFKGLAKHDPSGREFTYYAKEPTAPANYTATYSEDKLTVTNTYTIPTAGEFTAEKKWTGDETVTRPTVLFTLYRQVEGGEPEAVPGVEAKEITATETTATWTGLEETDINGKKYAFSVRETVKTPDASDDNWVFGEYTASADATAIGGITNRVIENGNPDHPDEKVATLTVKKILYAEPEEAKAEEDIVERLGGYLRDITAGGNAPENALAFTFKVTGPYGYTETFTVKAGEEKVLTGLFYGEYTVEEVETHGYTPDYGETDGVVTLRKDASDGVMIVTNRNIIPGPDDPENPNILSKTVKKVWQGGEKPSTTIQLKRKAGDLVDPLFERTFVTTAGKDGEETFTGLAKHSNEGVEWTYFAEEPQVPEGYMADYAEDGLTVTNTLKVYDFEVTKAIEKVVAADGTVRTSGRPEAIGDRIYYRFTVKNNGNVVIDKMHFKDTLIGVDETVEKVILPGESFVMKPNKYHEVTRKDVEAGKVDNTVEVTIWSGDDDVTGKVGTTSTNLSHIKLSKPPVAPLPHTGTSPDWQLYLLGLSAAVVILRGRRRERRG